MSRKRVSKEVAEQKFCIMIAEMRDDLSRGKISKRKLRVNRYLRRYNLGNYKVDRIKSLVLKTIAPTEDECKREYSAIKLEHSAEIATAKQFNSAISQSADLFAGLIEETSQKVSCNDKITEAIEYLKSKGYLIFKQY